MASSFMQDVKEAVISELWWPEVKPTDVERVRARAIVGDEDWRRIAIGVVRAGGAIVPRSQVRLLGNMLRVLEDAYLTANAGRARSGDFATYTFFRAQEAAIIDVMQTVRDVIDREHWPA